MSNDVIIDSESFYGREEAKVPKEAAIVRVSADLPNVWGQQGEPKQLPRVGKKESETNNGGTITTNEIAFESWSPLLFRQKSCCFGQCQCQESSFQTKWPVSRTRDFSERQRGLWLRSMERCQTQQCYRTDCSERTIWPITFPRLAFGLRWSVCRSIRIWKVWICKSKLRVSDDLSKLASSLPISSRDTEVAKTSSMAQ